VYAIVDELTANCFLTGRERMSSTSKGRKKLGQLLNLNGEREREGATTNRPSSMNGIPNTYRICITIYTSGNSVNKKDFACGKLYLLASQVEIVFSSLVFLRRNDLSSSAI